MIRQLRFFPSRTLALYVGKMFVLRTVAVLVMLVLILQVLDLLSESGKVLAVPGNGQDDVLRYIGLRLPQLIARFLPFSVLLGTIITLAGLNQNSEVISMKAGGMSAHQVLAPLVLASLFVAAISFGFNERVVARSNAALEQWQKIDYKPIPRESGLRTNIWVRDGDDLIRAGMVHNHREGVFLEDVTIFERNGNALAATVTSPRADPVGSGWRLRDARRFDIGSGLVTPLGTAQFSQGVPADHFTMSSIDGDALAFGPLARIVADREASGLSTDGLKATLWHKISGPLSAMLMPLLGAIAAFGLARSGRLVIRAVIAMALGFAYFVVDNFAIAMGNLGAYSPMIAAWGPFLLFFLIGETVLVRTEE